MTSKPFTHSPAESPRLLLNAREAAEALGISKRLLFDLTRRGELKVLRLPGRGKARSIRYALEDLKHWIETTKAKQADCPAEQVANPSPKNEPQFDSEPKTE